MIPPKSILITIDVEDWFQVENFKPYIPFSSWPERELRVEQNTHRLLDLFDSVEVAGRLGDKKQLKAESSKLKAKRKYNGHSTANNQSNHLNKPNQLIESVNEPRTTSNRPTKKVRCTFFVLGWLAERLPNLVREIQSRGHEVASHGCNHDLPNQLSANELKQDLLESKNQLEDITGAPVFGYRAPSFAINDDILKIIEDAGYLYDSSYNSFSLHGRYGQISLNGSGKKGIAHKLSDNFYELAVSNVHLYGRVIPMGGGGYFRLIPGPLFRLGIKHVLGGKGAYLFYMHPWEIDPDQPRVEKAAVGFKFRHYNNLGKTHSRLRDLIASFNSCNFMTCKEYLNSKV